MQLADICLYPICNAGYRTDGRDYQAFRANKKLINQGLSVEEVPNLGIKYSCFDKVKPAADQISA